MMLFIVLFSGFLAWGAWEYRQLRSFSKRWYMNSVRKVAGPYVQDNFGVRWFENRVVQRSSTLPPIPVLDFRVDRLPPDEIR
jgi:hypothetical protein